MVHQILFQVQNYILELVVVLDVVRTQHVHILHVIAEIVREVGLFLFLAAHPRNTRTETHQSVVNHKLQQGQQRYHQVKWQEGLLIQNHRTTLQKMK